MALSITPRSDESLPGSVVRSGARARRLPGQKAVQIAQAVLVVALAVAMGVLSLLAGGHMHALEAAGVSAGDGAIAGVGTFIDQIKGNLIWLGATIAGAAVFLIGGMYLAGHTRAQDYGMKFLIGCAIIAGGAGIVK